jgi:S-adenosylmethionine:tRNA ribosyltransferase-isomerase
MHISELDYDLPEELIAQEPIRPRDASRMLVLHRQTGELEHRVFLDLPEYLRPDDVVVLNNTRVLRARLRGRREPGGGKVEALLLTEREPGLWEALVYPGQRAQPGRQVTLLEGRLHAEVIARTEDGGRLLRFQEGEEVLEAIAQAGEVPLPPYIHQPVQDEHDYQTVYADVPGASAAPTAGLHFTETSLAAVRAAVQEVVYVTLHTGLGTFRPVQTERVEDHQMHNEWYSIPPETARVVNAARREGRRVVAVGTTSARALEAAVQADGSLKEGPAETALFITPGCQFKVVGALLTNFHMPRTTLLALLFAFAGREQVLRAYQEAVRQRYRFLSFGDAMLVI